MRTILLSAFAAVTLALSATPGLPAQPPADIAVSPSDKPIDQAAIDLLHKSQDAMFGLASYTAVCRTETKPASNGTGKTQYQLSWLIAAKPNKMRYEEWNLKSAAPTGKFQRPGIEPDNAVISDGSHMSRQVGVTVRDDRDVTPGNLATAGEPWRGFFAMQDSPYSAVMAARQTADLREARILGKEDVGGESCTKISIRISLKGDAEVITEKATLFLGPDLLPRRSIFNESAGTRQGPTRDSVLAEVTKNPPTDAIDFQTSASTEQGVTTTPPGAHNGPSASVFTSQLVNGKYVSLTDLRGKVVVIDFWASWCGPCMKSMPHNQTVMNKLHNEGLPVVMLAVDDGEDRNAFENWYRSRGAEFPDIVFSSVAKKGSVSGSLYRVSGIPTQFVVDANGTICRTFVGYGGENNDLENAVRAALK